MENTLLKPREEHCLLFEVDYIRVMMTPLWFFVAGPAFLVQLEHPDLGPRIISGGITIAWTIFYVYCDWRFRLGPSMPTFRWKIIEWKCMHGMFACSIAFQIMQAFSNIFPPLSYPPLLVIISFVFIIFIGFLLVFKVLPERVRKELRAEYAWRAEKQRLHL